MKTTCFSSVIKLGAGTVLLFSATLSAQAPPRSDFRTTILMSNLADPTQICFLPDGKIYELSKNGTIKLYDPVAKSTSTVATLTVSNVREDGLHSMVLDPNFATNRYAYLLFGVLSPSQEIVVSRFTIASNDLLDLTSRTDLLSIPYTLTSTNEHTTGCLAFDTLGNLYIGLADNTNNFFSGTITGYSPRNPAHPDSDAQRSAANSNDLRGKILRIHPEANGTYTIPAGNLWEKINDPSYNPNWNAASDDISKVRHEIYVMGVRHPFRITIDRETNWLYWAEPGPNATADDPNQGPRGYDIVALAKNPGYYTWPYCRGDVYDSNFCYKAYNYTTNVGGARYNPNAIKNTSPNNTGIVDLPPGRSDLIWYPYNAAGSAFPMFGSNGSMASMLGFVYYSDPSITSVNKIPRYYNHHLFIFDFQRSQVRDVALNDTGGVDSIETFWDQSTSNPITNPIHMVEGPDGAFYFLDWGDNGEYPNNSGNGNLVRLDYIGTPDPVLPPQTPAAKAPITRLVMAGLNRTVALPSGAVRADFYDLRGEKVWSWRQGQARHGWPVGTAVYRNRGVADAGRMGVGLAPRQVLPQCEDRNGLRQTTWS